jgi:hypothetical protein
MHRSLCRLLLVPALVVWAAGCSDSSTTPTTPTTPTLITDTYSETLTVNGAFTRTFLVVAAGDITATLTELSGDSTIVGLELGTSAEGVTCQHVLSNDSARKGTQLVGRASGGPAAFCARVYDTGHLTGPVDVTLQVVHP